MDKTVRLHIADMPTDLQARAKAAAAMAGITLKAWVKEAIREKLATKKAQNGKIKK
jgi:predicted HicB family RNase H-like nuclease